MHVLAFVNQKGGCGKTTTAVNLAGALSSRGARVLLVDMDPQAHATMALGHATSDAPTLLDVLERGESIDRARVDAAGGVSLVPSNERLVEFEESAARSLHAQSRLVRALERMQRPFDYVILDCPPRTEGVLAANALRATDTAVLVIEAGAFALQGAIRARALLEERLRAEKQRARLDGDASATDAFALRAVGTMFDKRARIARELLIGIHARFGSVLFDTAIRTSVRLREAAALGVTIQSLDPKGGAAQDFAALAAEVEAHAAAIAAATTQRDRARAARDAQRSAGADVAASVASLTT